jgi:regulator of replication initiation timing/transposase-like protein
MDAGELRRYERFKDEAQCLRGQVHHLKMELRALGPQVHRAKQKIDRLEQSNARYKAENLALRRKLADLTLQLKQQPKAAAAAAAAFVKASVARDKPAGKPGRSKGHVAALRPMPAKIDVHQTIDCPVDAQGKPSCPRCSVQLSDVKHHQRIVEELIPSRVRVTSYHTTSGYCPGCRKVVESRAPEQPPAADLPHAQLGLNALATAAVMRVCYRMPLRQITRLFKHLPGLSISPGAIVKQLERLGNWLEKQYHRLKLALRVAGVVHADETGWRTNGSNGYLWTLTNADHTLYHVDRSRGAKVIVELLGKAFGQTSDQTLVSDFYSVYDRFDSHQQKCLTHLLRELKQTVEKRPELTGHAFFVTCKRLVQSMLKLKKRHETMEPDKYAAAVKRCEDRLDQLAAQTWNDAADADRLTKRLRKHRDSLTTFLHKREVDGTNNAAERALRPAVVMRKITGGSRSSQGAKAWSILASVMRTAEQQGRDVLETIKTLLQAEWAGKDVALLTDSI